MLDDLSTDHKLALLRFMCSFAWSDLRVSEPERRMITHLVGRLGLSGADAELALSWLDFPPGEDEVDPLDVPLELRRLFAEAALEIACADGEVDGLEAESLALFSQLVDDEDDLEDEDTAPTLH